MSIITDLVKYRNYKCTLCGSKHTSFDKVNNKFKWYRTPVKDDVGFWCDNCYKYVYNQMKNSNGK